MPLTVSATCRHFPSGGAVRRRSRARRLAGTTVEEPRPGAFLRSPRSRLARKGTPVRASILDVAPASLQGGPSKGSSARRRLAPGGRDGGRLDRARAPGGALGGSRSDTAPAEARPVPALCPHGQHRRRAGDEPPSPRDCILHHRASVVPQKVGERCAASAERRLLHGSPEGRSTRRATDSSKAPRCQTNFDV